MSNYPQFNLEEVNGPKVLIQTNRGDIEIQLFPEQAPKTVENFVGLIEKEYYNGIIFHRVIPEFMVQGGDPTGTGMGGESFFGKEFEDEFSPEVFNLRGALSMANAGPNTNGSQFFIVQASNVPANMISQLEGAGYPEEAIKSYSENGGTPWLDGRHTVFGQVLSGMDVVDDMMNVARGAQDKPQHDIIMEKVSIL